MFVLEVVKALKKHKVKYALIGAYALAFYGLVRATRDVDIAILLNAEQLSRVEQALKGLHLTSRLPISARDIARFRKEYINKRNLIVWSFMDFKDPTRVVDVLLTDSLKTLSFQSFTVKKHKVDVLSLKDLLKLKQKSKRLKDKIDVQSVKDLLNEKKA